MHKNQPHLRIFIILITLATLFTIDSCGMGLFSQNLSIEYGTMMVHNTTASPGDTGIVIKISGEWSTALAAYTMCMHYDPAVLELWYVDFNNTLGESADFMTIWGSDEPGNVTAGAIWCEKHPSAGSGLLFNVIFNVSESAENGESLLDLTKQLQPQQITKYVPPLGTSGYIPLLTDGVLKITFDEPRYLLTVNTVGNGNVTIQPLLPWYASGTEVCLSAIPSIGWEFTCWTGDINGINTSEFILMDTNKTITACFKKMSSQSNIDADGQLDWTDIQPGFTVRTNITVTNSGAPSSFLSWEIAEIPDWGIWVVTPTEGSNLSIFEEDRIFVEIQIPSEKNIEYTGNMRLVNRDNRSDYVDLPVSVTTSKVRVVPFLVKYVLQRFSVCSKVTHILIS